MKVIKVISFVVLILGSSYFYGQGNGNGNGNGGNGGGNNGNGNGNTGNGPPGQQPCWPGPCVPIDGGISFLIAIGAAYGGKKAFDSLKTKD